MPPVPCRPGQKAATTGSGSPPTLGAGADELASDLPLASGMSLALLGGLLLASAEDGPRRLDHLSSVVPAVRSLARRARCALRVLNRWRRWRERSARSHEDRPPACGSPAYSRSLRLSRSIAYSLPPTQVHKALRVRLAGGSKGGEGSRRERRGRCRRSLDCDRRRPRPTRGVARVRDDRAAVGHRGGTAAAEEAESRADAAASGPERRVQHAPARARARG